jgi:hypothetical protein
VVLTAVQATLCQAVVVQQHVGKRSQDEIRPHNIGTLAVYAGTQSQRMQVVTCTNFMWTDVEGVAIEKDCSTAWLVHHAAYGVDCCP